MVASTEPPNGLESNKKRRNRAGISSVATQKRRERRESPPSVRRIGSVGRNRRVPATITILRERLTQLVERLRVVVGHPLLVS